MGVLNMFTKTGITGTTEDKLELTYPGLPWRYPLACRVSTGETGLGCRLCIAMHGIKAEEISDLPQTQDEFAAHMRQFHDRDAAFLKPDEQMAPTGDLVGASQNHSPSSR